MQTNATRAYDHLRRKLLLGDFQPGQRLLYGPLGREIGISATPVREAAQQLANEGLVELVPQLGAIVRRLDRTELVEIYEVRLAIEPYAARLAAERATKEQTEELQKLVRRMQELTDRQKAAVANVAGKRIRSQFDRADYQFHLCVIESTGNSAMVRTAGQSHALTRVFGIQRHQYDAVNMQQTCDDHRAILLAIQQASADRASEAAAQHIRNGLAVSLSALAVGRESGDGERTPGRITDAQ